MLYYLKVTTLASFLSGFELLLFGATLALYRKEAERIAQWIGPVGLYIAIPVVFIGYVSGSRLATLAQLLIEDPIIAYIVFASTCVRTTFHPVFESSTVTYIGRISYGLYLF
jgi:peptidoglycan/LPS O-acetylase OafA/YrhL